jgi:hypothetical protein
VKTSRLKAGAKSVERRSTFAAEPKPLERKSELKRHAEPADGAPRKSFDRPRPISPASPAQRERIRGRVCCVTDCFAEFVHPAHLIDRSLGGDDDPRAVVPLCPPHHREYDDDKTLDLLPHLEPHFRVELAYAVELVGLVTALERITNDRWTTERSAAA